MTDKQPTDENRDHEEINLDRPFYLDPDTVLPGWVDEKIETTNEYSFKDVFISQKTETGGFCNTLQKQKLYPLTVFCLLQQLMARTDIRWHQLGTIIDQHKQWKVGYRREPAYETYWKKVDKLVEVGIVKKIEDGTKTKYGLPDGNGVAPAFDPDHPDNILDRVTMDDPIPRDDLETTIWPISLKTDRPAIKPSSGRLENPWDCGLVFLTAGVALTILYVETPGPVDLTTYAPEIFWTFISIGIAAMVVDILDQVRAGYQKLGVY